MRNLFQTKSVIFNKSSMTFMFLKISFMCFAYERYHSLFNTDGTGNLDIKYGVTLTVGYKIFCIFSFVIKKTCKYILSKETLDFCRFCLENFSIDNYFKFFYKNTFVLNYLE